ncbi:MAG: hypothetical protein KKF41_13165 [Actinobacteria bacterium]|nr:hypothetical protein [Actinomycetota bacterium]MBU1944031.1 hypothetical protein [Actinomycetota bacterium]MBU2688527.1 hypothetical protein [Actinomycetota bacterium]
MSDPVVAGYIEEHFVPWHVDHSRDTALVTRFDVFMTPTQLYLDEKGREFYRTVAFLPPDRFLAYLALGRGMILFRTLRYQEAADVLDTVPRDLVECGATPEAILFRGVALDKLSGGHSNRKRSGLELQERYPDSDWAWRSLVWRGQ